MATVFSPSRRERHILTPGLLTWSENTCEVCGLEEPKTRLVRHVLPAHRLERVAALHNYLALIITTSGRRGQQAIPASVQVSDVQTSRRACTMSGVLDPAYRFDAEPVRSRTQSGATEASTNATSLRSHSHTVDGWSLQPARPVSACGREGCRRWHTVRASFDHRGTCSRPRRRTCGLHPRRRHRGADLNRGSGIIGPKDRGEALGGRISVVSPAGDRGGFTAGCWRYLALPGRALTDHPGWPHRHRVMA